MSRSAKGHHLNIFDSNKYSLLYTPSFKAISQFILEREIFNILTIYGLVGHASHVTLSTNFHSNKPSRLYMYMPFGYICPEAKQAMLGIVKA